MTRTTDVLIIGAGVAGLTAAHELCTAGLHATILEARDRIGGRILTHHTKQYPVELGAEFVHGRPPGTIELIKKGNLPLAELQGVSWYHERNTWVRADDMLPDFVEVFGKMSDHKPDQSFQQYLESVEASEEAKQHAMRFVEGFHAADPQRVSVHWLVRSNEAEEKIDGNRQFRIASGYDRLVNSIASQLPPSLCDLRLNTAATEIAWQPREVTISCDNKSFHARCVLITVPVAILKSGKIRFTPELPEKQQALAAIEMGPVVRASLCFKEKFWEAHFKDLTFMFTDDEQFPTWWTSHPLPFPILTGWAAGRYARKLFGAGHEHVIERALQSLGSIFGMSQPQLRQQFEAGFTYDWQSDPFSCGAYSYALVGGSGAPQEFAKPVADTLFFAGEATDPEGHNGTVHGAIASGKRAAKELLKAVA